MLEEKIALVPISDLQLSLSSCNSVQTREILCIEQSSKIHLGKGSWLRYDLHRTHLADVICYEGERHFRS